MAKFCGDCGKKLDGKKHECSAKKSFGSLSTEDLEKSLSVLETLSKGVRPELAEPGDEADETLDEQTEAARKQLEEYGDEGESESEHEPETDDDEEDVAKADWDSADEPNQDDDSYEDDSDEEAKREDEDEDGPMYNEPNPKRAFKSSKKVKKSKQDGNEYGTKMRYTPKPKEDKYSDPAGDPKAKSAKKSVKKSFESSPSITKGVEVSDFLRDLVNKSVESHEYMDNKINKSLAFSQYQKNFNIGLAKSLIELADIIKSLTERVEKVSKGPAAMRKSDLGTPVDRPFADPNNPVLSEREQETINKSLLAEKVFALRKGGDPVVTDYDVMQAEMYGKVRPEIKAKLGLK